MTPRAALVNLLDALSPLRVMGRPITELDTGLGGAVRDAVLVVSEIADCRDPAALRETIRRVVHDMPMRTGRASAAAEYLGVGWCDNLTDAIVAALCK